MSSHDQTVYEFLHYNRWANLALLDACLALTPEQFASSTPGAYGSIYDTLRHIIRAETFYYRLVTGIRLEPPFSWDDRPALEEIRPYAEQVSSALLEAADQMVRAEPVVEEVEGEIYRYKSMTLLIQTVNHGVEHRTNITTILAQLGIEPPEIDGWAYMMAHPDRLGA
jgi:uncharacterized damage-inducible protein DinB